MPETKQATAGGAPAWTRAWPWILLALWALWLVALIVMSRPEWGRRRPVAPDEGRTGERRLPAPEEAREQLREQLRESLKSRP